jgi:dipeptidyl aminopeptidase/acylaminoacyl peptidase
MTGGEDATYLVGSSPDSKYIYLSRDSKGDEYPGIYRQPINGGPLELIYRKKKVKTRLLWIDLDGKHIYYRANDKDPKSFSIYKYNLKSKESRLVFEGEGWWYMGDKRKDGTLLLGRAVTNIASEFYTYDEKTKKLTPVVGVGEQEQFSVRFAPKKGEFFVLTNKFSEFKRIYKLKIFKNRKETMKFIPITDEMDADVGSMSTDRPRKKLIYEINDKGYWKIGALNAKTLKEIPVPKFKDAVSVYFGHTTRNGRYSSVGVTKANAPRANYIYDWKTKKLRPWSLPSTPEIDTSNFAADSLEYYTAEDGTKIPMFVKRPKECIKKSCPVVVRFHGGPESQSYPGFSTYAQLFVEEGFVYVRPNVRGSRGYGKTWLNSDNGPKRLNVITDIRDAAVYIKKNWSYGGVTPKLAITGGSYGGYSTFIGMTMFAGHYDVGVSSVGMSSLVTFLQNTAPYRRKLRESEYGYLDKDMDALIKLSPTTYLDKLNAPLLIMQGATDPRVPAGEAVQIQEKLQTKGIDSKLILFPDEGHGIRKRKNRVITIGHTLSFLKKHLKEEK